MKEHDPSISPGVSQPSAEDPLIQALVAKVESALSSQASPAAAYVRNLRTKNPQMTPADLLRKLERRLLTTSTTAGTAAGATAAAPGVGKRLSAVLTLGGQALSIPAAVFHILAVAEVYEVSPVDIEHRRKLLLSILIQTSESAIPKVSQRTGKHWARITLDAIPGKALKPLNDVLGHNFITKSGNTGVVVLANVLPYAMGGAIGFGYSLAATLPVIAATRAAFGPPRATFSNNPAGTAGDVSAD